jgi:poly(3-hydroxybutyrate) depolymerase
MGSGTPQIPAATEACPQLVTGNITVLGQSVTIYAGSKSSGAGAPILFYWHGTGSSAGEAQAEMGTEITEITGEGGLVASFSTSLGTGTDTGDAVWYTDDFKMCDQILACAVQQLNIDTHRIYTAGCSAGGLQAGAMVYQRSSYLAAAMPNSGGISPIPGLNAFQDSHIPALITTHGAAGTDVVVLDFSQASLNECKDVKSHGGFVVDCNHGGMHCGAPANDIAAQWQFCKDHPFGVSPEPYASSLPSSFPSYCTIQ